MNAVFFEKIKDVKDVWLYLEKKERFDTYQTYDWNFLLYQNRKTSISNLINQNTKTYFIVIYEGSIPKCIAPIIEGKIDGKKYIRLLGHGTATGYLDFVYTKDTTHGEIQYCINCLKKRFENYNFEFSELCSNSLLYRQLLKDDLEFISQNRRECYAIKLSGTYNDYFKSLSKSVRQNIRTSYNHLASDQMEYQFKIYNYADNISNKLEKQLYHIYTKRREEWGEDKKNNRLLKIYKRLRGQNRDIVFQSLNHIKESCVGVLFIHNQPAAFLIGYKNENTLIVPRLAIDTTFARYSPGGILLIEYIKYLYDNKMVGGKYVFDLSRGNEKYKSSYGGILFYTETITFRQRSSHGENKHYSSNL